MDALQLDFVQSARRQRSSGVLLLAAGVMAVFLVGYWRVDLRAQTQSLEGRLARLERQAGGLGAASARVDARTALEVQRANEVIDQLALPWDRLFRAVESAAGGPVTLLGIAPDARNGVVQISAETADADDMFAYVRRLEQQSELTNVYLLEHQRDKRGANLLRFVVTASWLTPQPGR